jgi:hypothetical protein
MEAQRLLWSSTYTVVSLIFIEYSSSLADGCVSHYPPLVRQSYDET